MSVVSRLKSSIKACVPASWHARLDSGYARFTAPLYAGSAVSCNVCGGAFRRFLPEANGREFSRCPRCRSQERHRLLVEYLGRNTGLFVQSTRLLHMAPEPALEKRLRAIPGTDYLSADLLSPRAMMNFDLTKVPLPDSRFDVILCNHVLEHIPDDRQAMREMFRLLAPGGWAILMVPLANRPETDEDLTVTDPRERERRFMQHDHVRLYGIGDYRARLESAGFQVEMCDFARSLPADQSRRLGINPSEIIPIARRPA